MAEGREQLMRLVSGPAGGGGGCWGGGGDTELPESSGRSQGSDVPLLYLSLSAGAPGPESPPLRDTEQRESPSTSSRCTWATGTLCPLPLGPQTPRPVARGRQIPLTYTDGYLAGVVHPHTHLGTIWAMLVQIRDPQSPP